MSKLGCELTRTSVGTVCYMHVHTSVSYPTWNEAVADHPLGTGAFQCRVWLYLGIRAGGTRRECGFSVTAVSVSDNLLQPGCLSLSVRAVSVVFCCFVKTNSLPFPTPACLFLAVKTTCFSSDILCHWLMARVAINPVGNRSNFNVYSGCWWNSAVQLTSLDGPQIPFFDKRHHQATLVC